MSTTPDHARLVRRGRLLECLTLGWNMVGVVVLAFAAITAGSVAAAGFGFDSLIEIGACVPPKDPSHGAVRTRAASLRNSAAREWTRTRPDARPLRALVQRESRWTPMTASGDWDQKAAGKHGDVVFGKVDTEAQTELAQTFGISSIPTLMAIRDGVVLYAQPGARPSRHWNSSSSRSGAST